MYLRKLKKTIRSIILSPLWMFGIMGVPPESGGEGESAGSESDDFSPDALSAIAGEGPTLSQRIMAFAGESSDYHQVPKDAAASEDDESDADQTGTQDDTKGVADKGLDTQSEEDGSDADQDEGSDDDTTSQEATEGTEGKKKGINQKSWEERQKEIEDRVYARIKAEQAGTAAEKPDWVPINQEAVDEFIAAKEEEIDELRLAGKYSEARKISRELDQLDKDLEENEQKRAAFLDRQKSRKAETDHGEVARQELDHAAELYRSEMKIDKPLWDKMGTWFESEVTSKPLLMAEFNDIYARQGKVAAIRFAHQHTVENMGKAAKQANEKKEQTKNQTAKLTTSNAGKVAPIDIEKERKRLYANLPPDEAFMKLQELKRQVKVG